MSSAFQAAHDLACDRMRKLEHRERLAPREVAPGVLLRSLNPEQVIERLREKWGDEVAVHNAQVISIEPRLSARALRDEVLAQFTNRARSLAR